MGATIDVQRLGLKIFVDDPTALRPSEIVPVFHRWIQTRAVEGLLIDVASYDHLPGGPGAVLVTHEGNYSLDREDNRAGLLYQRKEPVAGILSDRLRSLARTVCRAGRLLEEDPSLDPRPVFQAQAIQLIANDRLLAPNTDDTWAAFRPSVDEFLSEIYGAGAYTLSRSPDGRSRFSLTATTPTPLRIQTLLDRLGG